MRSRFAIACKTHKEFAFEENLTWFKNHDFDLADFNDEEFYQWIHQLVDSMQAPETGVRHMLVDVSSMTRSRIAAIVSALRACASDCPFSVDFVYSLAKYSKPAEAEVPIDFARPVLSEFAAWPDDLQKPIAAILGIGFEHTLELGTIEYLEAGLRWAMYPSGGDKRYAKTRRRDLGPLVTAIDKRNVLEYLVRQPFDTFVKLESLIAGCLKISRPVIVPFGPKIFSVCSLLVATIHNPRVAVWRVSAGPHAAIVDREPTGEVVGLRVDFAPRS